MVRRSLDTFPAVLAHLGNLRLAVRWPLADVRSAGFEVLSQLGVPGISQPGIL